jgi:hypothetical protein
MHSKKGVSTVRLLKKFLSTLGLGLMVLTGAPLLASSSVLLINPTIEPTPLDPVELKGEGTISFGLVENLGGTAPSKDLFGEPNVQISIEFTNIRLKNDNVKLIKGDMPNYFEVVFNKKDGSMKLVQKKDITPELNLSIIIPIQVTKNTVAGGNERNGFNANIAAGHSSTFANSSAAEFTNTKTLVDTDGDKIPDITDNDDDNDGILDDFEGNKDSDGDKIPDRLDPDVVPTKSVDAKYKKFGKKETSIEDTKVTGDVNTEDSDKDGILDIDDIDDDNDGILDTLEGNGTVDTDGDKLPDSLDKDSDGDNIPDRVEAYSKDGKGKVGFKVHKLDANEDGLYDVYTKQELLLVDSDGDTIPDLLDSEDNTTSKEKKTKHKK